MTALLFSLIDFWIWWIVFSLHVYLRSLEFTDHWRFLDVSDLNYGAWDCVFFFLISVLLTPLVSCDNILMSFFSNVPHRTGFLLFFFSFVVCLTFLPNSCSDYLFKLLLIGDSGVGKSCLLLRFAVSYPASPLSLYFPQLFWGLEIIRYWTVDTITCFA